ncbi:uncharacterized protein A4U43_C03F25030 [Asparagus officinalis]|uniref:Uncharacterized protein n=1 Tax=Asparagus officinalis TaxID=4686 RepID=A0A5P1FDM1_ASPOF|nr:uncharacterized protein A4U43_C03F25030 [Asparagus officinalis]
MLEISGSFNSLLQSSGQFGDLNFLDGFDSGAGSDMLQWRSDFGIDSILQVLLALEERIGNLSTGLSEADISRYIVEATYRSPNQVQDKEEEKLCNMLGRPLVGLGLIVLLWIAIFLSK